MGSEAIIMLCVWLYDRPAWTLPALWQTEVMSAVLLVNAFNGNTFMADDMPHSYKLLRALDVGVLGWVVSWRWMRDWREGEFRRRW